jgi:two-component system, sensor histidine kinase PdtaS
VDELPLTAAEFDRVNSAFFEHAPVAKILIDANSLIAMANGEAERLFGYYREELLGRPFDTLIAPNVRAVHAAERQVFLAEPHVSRWGIRSPLIAQAKDGREFPIDVAYQPMHTDDGLMIAISIADLSERFALYEERERTARALAADALPALEELTVLAEHAQLRDVTACVKHVRAVIAYVLESTWSKM